MKSLVLKTALVAIALCAPVALHAQTDTTNPIATSPVKNPPAAPAAKKAAKTAYKGTVKSIDASSVVVTTKSGDLTLAIDAKTKFHANKKKAAASDISVGEKVTGSYSKDDTGAMTACSINGHTK